jgi:hypothetical protein
VCVLQAAKIVPLFLKLRKWHTPSRNILHAREGARQAAGGGGPWRWRRRRRLCRGQSATRAALLPVRVGPLGSRVASSSRRSARPACRIAFEDRVFSYNPKMNFKAAAICQSLKLEAIYTPDQLDHTVVPAPVLLLFRSSFTLDSIRCFFTTARRWARASWRAPRPAGSRTGTRPRSGDRRRSRPSW